jgi:signal transduction histidine kinase
MKLGTKIFFCVTIFFSITFLFCGYSLISYFYKISMEREVDSAIEQYQYNKFVMQATLITKGEDWIDEVVNGEYDISSMVSDMSDTVAVLSLDGTAIYSAFPTEMEFSDLLVDVKQDQVSYQFLEIGKRTYLLVIGKVVQADTGIYLISGINVENVLEQHEQIIRKFEKIYAVAIGIGILLIFGLSALLTRPIKVLSEATRKIAGGNYKERIKVTSTDEVGQLAENFNQMAFAVEEKVQELSDSARQKEDFVANFAHELKTPLTSIIGYANRIYQKELPREEQKQAAWYIWNEGMRLESLSKKLMDLTVLNHKDFVLQEIQADLLLHELETDVAYLMTEKGVSLECTAEAANIKVEYDLFKTLFLNLVDNSIKAGADHIMVTGTVKSEELQSNYIIQVEDNGNGIPKEEIGRITEAFYMVDKSRSRKLHGAGIGLALVKKIAEIHGANLAFESDGKSGTKVSISLRCEGATYNE